MSQQVKENQSASIKRWAIGLISGAIALVAFYAGIILYFTWPVTEFSVAQSGVFGDSFGLLTSLFSGLAFSGLIVTILLQREDLNLQRQELSETRKEMKFQNFETTFFQMLRLHNDILASIDLLKVRTGRTTETTGRDCFNTFYKRLKDTFNLQNETKRAQPIALITCSYRAFWQDHRQDLGHYYRYLYRIFKYVDESSIPSDEKQLYASIIRAQLSDMEIALLFYNCLSEFGSEKFKPLVEKYALLDNLQEDLLFEKDHRNLYSLGAY